MSARVYSGEQHRPTKRMLLVGLCRMKKMKGWSATNSAGIVIERTSMSTPVAAAASVPSSFTSTKALWTTLDTIRSFAGDIPSRWRAQKSVVFFSLTDDVLQFLCSQYNCIIDSVCLIGAIFLTREVSLVDVKGVLHSHVGQDFLQVILLLHLKSRELDINLVGAHHVWASPVHKVLIGQLLLQLCGYSVTSLSDWNWTLKYW